MIRDGDRREIAELFRRCGMSEVGDDVMLVAVDPDLEQIVGGLTGAASTDYSEHLAEHVAPPQAYLGKIAVDPERRRSGAGRALLGEFARRGREAGSTQLVAVVDASADDGRRAAFFRFCGCRMLDTAKTSNNGAIAGHLDEVAAACAQG